MFHAIPTARSANLLVAYARHQAQCSYAATATATCTSVPSPLSGGDGGQPTNTVVTAGIDNGECYAENNNINNNNNNNNISGSDTQQGRQNNNDNNDGENSALAPVFDPYAKRRKAIQRDEGKRSPTPTPAQSLSSPQRSNRGGGGRTLPPQIGKKTPTSPPPQQQQEEKEGEEKEDNENTNKTQILQKEEELTSFGSLSNASNAGSPISETASQRLRSLTTTPTPTQTNTNNNTSNTNNTAQKTLTEDELEDIVVGTRNSTAAVLQCVDTMRQWVLGGALVNHVPSQPNHNSAAATAAMNGVSSAISPSADDIISSKKEAAAVGVRAVVGFNQKEEGKGAEVGEEGEREDPPTPPSSPAGAVAGGAAWLLPPQSIPIDIGYFSTGLSINNNNNNNNNNKGTLHYPNDDMLGALLNLAARCNEALDTLEAEDNAHLFSYARDTFGKKRQTENKNDFNEFVGFGFGESNSTSSSPLSLKEKQKSESSGADEKRRRQELINGEGTQPAGDATAASTMPSTSSAPTKSKRELFRERVLNNNNNSTNNNTTNTGTTVISSNCASPPPSSTNPSTMCSSADNSMPNLHNGSVEPLSSYENATPNTAVAAAEEKINEKKKKRNNDTKKVEEVDSEEEEEEEVIIFIGDDVRMAYAFFINTATSVRDWAVNTRNLAIDTALQNRKNADTNNNNNTANVITDDSTTTTTTPHATPIDVRESYSVLRNQLSAIYDYPYSFLDSTGCRHRLTQPQFFDALRSVITEAEREVDRLQKIESTLTSDRQALEAAREERRRVQQQQQEKEGVNNGAAAAPLAGGGVGSVGSANSGLSISASAAATTALGPAVVYSPPIEQFVYLLHTARFYYIISLTENEGRSVNFFTAAGDMLKTQLLNTQALINENRRDILLSVEKRHKEALRAERKAKKERERAKAKAEEEEAAAAAVDAAGDTNTNASATYTVSPSPNPFRAEEDEKEKEEEKEKGENLKMKKETDDAPKPAAATAPSQPSSKAVSNAVSVAEGDLLYPYYTAEERSALITTFQTLAHLKEQFSDLCLTLENDIKTKNKTHGVAFTGAIHNKSSGGRDGIAFARPRDAVGGGGMDGAESSARALMEEALVEAGCFSASPEKYTTAPIPAIKRPPYVDAPCPSTTSSSAKNNNKNNIDDGDDNDLSTRSGGGVLAVWGRWLTSIPRKATQAIMCQIDPAVVEAQREEQDREEARRRSNNNKKKEKKEALRAVKVGEDLTQQKQQEQEQGQQQEQNKTTMLTNNNTKHRRRRFVHPAFRHNNANRFVSPMVHEKEHLLASLCDAIFVCEGMENVLKKLYPTLYLQHTAFWANLGGGSGSGGGVFSSSSSSSSTLLKGWRAAATAVGGGASALVSGLGTLASKAADRAEHLTVMFGAPSTNGPTELQPSNEDKLKNENSTSTSAAATETATAAVTSNAAAVTSNGETAAAAAVSDAVTASNGNAIAIPESPLLVAAAVVAPSVSSADA